MQRAIKESIACYRDGDFSKMREDAREAILSLYKNDDEKPAHMARIQISTNLLLMGKALQDNRLLRMAVEVLMVNEKVEAIDILLRTQEILRENGLS
ncbi:hypothetical protein [Rahnella sp. AN3-3W3]|uniref:hypothetical protein n=1 Tax=Rahnella sp. AN3-3W3 TaxID=1610578 RepID=UPI000DD33465|nr:hypothetical protein [Rahnella sp. AN3-3W3]